MRLPPLVEHCAWLLSPLGAVRVRRMFGGWGLYVDELFLAIVAFERLYLKTTPESLPRFIAAGGEAFRYSAKGREVTLSYCTAPAEALDSPAQMTPWARLALQAALQARAAAPPAILRPPARAARKPAARKPRG
jgi:DNA transformation protein